MKRFYRLLRRDILKASDKIALTYERTDEPNWFAGLFGAKPQRCHVKFVGKDHKWVELPAYRECTFEEVQMLRSDDARKETEVAHRKRYR